MSYARVNTTVIKSAITNFKNELVKEQSAIYKEYNQYCEYIANHWLLKYFINTNSEKVVSKYKNLYDHLELIRYNIEQLEKVCDITTEESINLDIKDAYLIAKYYVN